MEGSYWLGHGRPFPECNSFVSLSRHPKNSRLPDCESLDNRFQSHWDDTLDIYINGTIKDIFHFSFNGYHLYGNLLRGSSNPYLHLSLALDRIFGC